MLGRRHIRWLCACGAVAALLGAALPPSTASGTSPRADTRAGRSLQAADAATQAGIAQVTPTWSLSVGDVNADGRPDFLLVRHTSGPASLYRNNGDGTFTEIDAGNFPTDDRLGCAFADVNQDGRQDLYCSVGDEHSTAQNPKELWIQQPDGTFTDEAAAYGVTDPVGRERWPVFIDVNHDAYPDLFVDVYQPRRDGLPEANHLYLNEGGTSYTDVPSYGLDTTSGVVGGSGCAQAVDYNGDGWQDLLLCGQDWLHLYRNDNGTGFTDVTEAAGLGHTVWRDADLADLNGDGLPDLVEVKKGLAQIRFAQPGGTFAKPVRLATLSQGFSLTVGDVNGDGHPDVYLVQTCPSQSTADAPDLLFVNVGDGTFAQVSTPQASSGCGDVAAPIDVDGDGHDEILVANGFGTDGSGRWVAGPLQLLAVSG